MPCTPYRWLSSKVVTCNQFSHKLLLKWFITALLIIRCVVEVFTLVVVPTCGVADLKLLAPRKNAQHVAYPFLCNVWPVHDTATLTLLHPHHQPSLPAIIT